MVILFYVLVSIIYIILIIVMGVGVFKRFKLVKWGVVKNIVWVWVLIILIIVVFLVLIIDIMKLFM